MKRETYLVSEFERFTLHVRRFTRYSCILRLCDDVGICFFDAIDRMDFGNHHVGERSFVLDADEDKNIRAAEAGVSLFNAWDALQCADHVLRFSCFDLDENVRSRCHVILLY